MAKRTKQGHRRTRTDDMDKPAYAMDVIPDKPKKPEKEKPKEEAFHIGDTIGGQAAEKLAQLKSQLADVEMDKTKAKEKPKRKVQSAKERLEENPDLSFAELFDPQEDDEQSFDELLKSSKLDWHHFKDE
ncbi:hypothetical protein [Alicyclobacillus dauci]|uniref:Uncharacterized protein n=1 Tax=Alicyclobacillus dauci TaxID=1475485 RepID=A0ABY6YYW7_9BACL|nr:hypothetical protein [Alicyclobacillus dauci]WAH35809.1 hypothetical protein NZD86_16250 [Alicyclobacillus dauci]